MKCKECNSKIKKKREGEFCPYCGATLEGKTTSPENMMVDINVILDRSGSMSVNKDTTIKSFNNYILEQSQVEGNATISLYSFNQYYKVIYENEDIKKAPPLTSSNYETTGSTALLDAVGKTIATKSTHYDLLSKKEKPDKILFVIITDGEENASREFSRSMIKQLIEERKEKGWDFAFIGAGIDAFSERNAGGMAISHYATMKVNNDNDGWNHAFSNLTGSTTSYRTSNNTAKFAFGEYDPGEMMKELDKLKKEKETDKLKKKFKYHTRK